MPPEEGARRPTRKDSQGALPDNGAVTDATPPRLRLDRPVLVSNLGSGALWLSPLAFLSWPLLAIGVPYVIAGAVYLAAVYGRRSLTRRQELLAWAAPWLVAVAVWSVVVGSIEFESTATHYLSGLYAGVLIATRPGEEVRAGEAVIELLYNDDAGVGEAIALAREAIEITDEPPALRPLILGVVR